MVNLNDIPKGEVVPSKVRKCCKFLSVFLFFFKKKKQIFLVKDEIVLFFLLSEQKLTWRSKQQDRENCAMKGKHKVSLSFKQNTLSHQKNLGGPDGCCFRTAN